MANVRFYGNLRDQFGEGVLGIKVKSFPELMRALSANYKGFREYMYSKEKQFFVELDGERVGYDFLKKSPLGEEAEVHLVPVIQGAKSDGELILTGALLIGTGLWAATAFSGFVAGNVGGFLFNTTMAMGINMVGAGLYNMLYTPEDLETEDKIESNLFNGPVNTVAQGHPVPIGYGRLRIGSAVISSGLERKGGNVVPIGTVGGSEAQ